MAITRPRSDDTVDVHLGSGSVKKILTWILGIGSAFGSGAYIKTQVSDQIDLIKAQQVISSEKISKLDGKVDLLIELAKERRRSR